MPIHQALTKSKKIRVVLPRHEQGGAFAAEGYARATGRARCLYGDIGTRVRRISSPALPMPSWTRFRWWQSPGKSIRKHDRAGAFQGDRCVRHDAADGRSTAILSGTSTTFRALSRRLSYCAELDVPGPVLIDIPKNIQIARTQPIYPRSVKLRGYNPIRKADGRCDPRANRPDRTRRKSRSSIVAGRRSPGTPPRNWQSLRRELKFP